MSIMSNFDIDINTLIELNNEISAVLKVYNIVPEKLITSRNKHIAGMINQYNCSMDYIVNTAADYEMINDV